MGLHDKTHQGFDQVLGMDQTAAGQHLSVMNALSCLRCFHSSIYWTPTKQTSSAGSKLPEAVVSIK